MKDEGCHGITLSEFHTKSYNKFNILPVVLERSNIDLIYKTM